MIQPDKTHPLCSFHGGTLHGKKERRMMFGFVSQTIMEPLYIPDKAGNCHFKNIWKRQVYARSPQHDFGGALGYRLNHVIENES